MSFCLAACVGQSYLHVNDLIAELKKLFTHQQSENMFNKHDTRARYSELINTLFFYHKVMFNLLVIGN